MSTPGELGPVSINVSVSQTSIRSGNVLGMGKGFHCSKLVHGHDLGEIIEQACQRAVRVPPFSFTVPVLTLAASKYPT